MGFGDIQKVTPGTLKRRLISIRWRVLLKGLAGKFWVILS